MLEVVAVPAEAAAVDGLVLLEVARVDDAAPAVVAQGAGVRLGVVQVRPVPAAPVDRAGRLQAGREGAVRADGGGGVAAVTVVVEGGRERLLVTARVLGRLLGGSAWAVDAGIRTNRAAAARTVPTREARPRTEAGGLGPVEAGDGEGGLRILLLSSWRCGRSDCRPPRRGGTCRSLQDPRRACPYTNTSFHDGVATSRRHSETFGIPSPGRAGRRVRGGTRLATADDHWLRTGKVADTTEEALVTTGDSPQGVGPGSRARRLPRCIGKAIA